MLLLLLWPMLHNISSTWIYTLFLYVIYTYIHIFIYFLSFSVSVLTVISSIRVHSGSVFIHPSEFCSWPKTCWRLSKYLSKEGRKKWREDLSGSFCCWHYFGTFHIVIFNWAWRSTYTYMGFMKREIVP